MTVTRTPPAVPTLAELPILATLPPIIPLRLGCRRWRPNAIARAATCVRDGIGLDEHPRCHACGMLAGDGHQLAVAQLAGGVCGACRGGQR